MLNNHIFYYLSLCVFLLVSCTNINQEEKEGAIPTLNIEWGLQNLTKRNLSDFASNIRYVRLETTEHSLIGDPIRNIWLEENKIFVHHSYGIPFLKVFDAYTGEHLHNIGRRGQGPEELTILRYIDINVTHRRIILGGERVLKFDFEGNFLGSIALPELPDSFSTDVLRGNVVMLDKNLFSVGAFTLSYHQHNAIYLFDRQANIVGALKSYDQLQRNGTRAFSPDQQVGFHYRFADQVYFFRGLSDTVFTFNPIKKEFEPHLVFNFGRHREPRASISAAPGDTPQNPNLVSVRSGRISENERYVFIDFSTLKASTEPFENYRFLSGVQRFFLDHSLYAIFDKQEREFQFLLQPIPGIRGIANDIDGGIPFFPKLISSTGEMVDWHQAYKFIELAERLPNPDEAFLQMVRSIDEDDNPIVIIAAPLR